MECPFCNRKIEALEAGRCPHCGRPLQTTLLGVVKTSQVRISAGGEDRVYTSIDEVPPEVRKQIRRALNGPLSDTIVIADEAGRQRIFEAIRGLPPHLQKKVMAAVQVAGDPPPRLSRRARIAIAVGIGVGVAVLLAHLWV
jgi:hypothetical protein